MLKENWASKLIDRSTIEFWLVRRLGKYCGNDELDVWRWRKSYYVDSKKLGEDEIDKRFFRLLESWDD